MLQGQKPPGSEARQCGADAVVEALCHVIGNAVALDLALRNARWNLSGPFESQQRALLQAQRAEIDRCLDLLASQVRKLSGEPRVDLSDSVMPIDRLRQICQLAPAAMLKELAVAHDRMIGSLEAALDVARDAGDDASVLLITQGLLVHEKHRAGLLQESERQP